MTIASVAGFNLDEPGDPYHFTHLSVLFSNKPTLQLINSKYGDDCTEEALKGYALVSGFLSTLAQAHVRGMEHNFHLLFKLSLYSTDKATSLLIKGLMALFVNVK